MLTATGPIRSEWRNPDFPPDFDDFPRGVVHCAECGTKLRKRKPLNGRKHFCKDHTIAGNAWQMVERRRGNYWLIDEDGYPVTRYEYNPSWSNSAATEEEPPDPIGKGRGGVGE